MGAPQLDHQFLQYWAQLSQPQKQSLLSVAKNYVDTMQENGPVTPAQYNKEINDSMQEIENGNFIPHQKAVSTSQSWLNGQ
jgi:hypothetical protein